MSSHWSPLFSEILMSLQFLSESHESPLLSWVSSSLSETHESPLVSISLSDSQQSQ